MAVGIGDWTATRELNGIYADARELGLEANIAELATYGFTTIPDALGADLVERLIAAINDSVAETTGRAPDMETGAGHVDINFQPFLLYRDRAFEEALMNDPVLTLIHYLLGNSCVLSSLSSHFKGPGDQPLPLGAPRRLLDTRPRARSAARTRRRRARGSAATWRRTTRPASRRAGR